MDKGTLYTHPSKIHKLTPYEVAHGYGQKQKVIPVKERRDA